MVPLDRALVSSYRLSIVTMSLSASVWLQFASIWGSSVAQWLGCWTLTHKQRRCLKDHKHMP